MHAIKFWYFIRTKKKKTLIKLNISKKYQKTMYQVETRIPMSFMLEREFYAVKWTDNNW